MPTRIVAHALARWTDPDGTHRLASHGQTIDINDATAAALDAAGATTPATVVLMTTVAGEETREDKRARIAEALKAAPHLSNRRHADQIGADHKTVGTIRKALEEAGEIPHPDQTSPPTPAADRPSRPRPTATHERWIAYAIARGIDRDEAESSTKDQLIAATDELDRKENPHG
ncbi:hypothetical protein ACGFIU_24915 [Rhodococcus oryzae]|uniref:hypothetical protein n=1 Tax=Rhodococcus oryzae TaxID=2571143 RepID=UPI0037164484